MTDTETVDMDWTQYHGDAPDSDDQDTESSSGLEVEPGRFGLFLGVLVAMTVLGGWQLLVIVLAVVGFIIIHELGHYLTAKWSGMKVTEFFIGFGPQIIAFRRGETLYGIKALPFGAYVRIIGMNNLEDVDSAEEHRAYRSKPWHNRFITTAAGPATHFLIAVVLATVAIWQVGEEVEGAWQVEQIIPFSAAEGAGLERGDQILALNETSTDDFEVLTDLVQGVRGEVVELTIGRDGEQFVVETRIGERLTATGSRGISGLYEGDLILAIDGQEVANYDQFASLAADRLGQQATVDVVYDGERHSELVTINRIATEDAVVGFLGVARGAIREPLPVGDALLEGPRAVGETTVAVTERFADLFTSREGWSALFSVSSDVEPESTLVVNDPEQIRPRPQIDENRLLSIVGAVAIGEQLVDEGLAYVLAFFVGLNISLALLNLIPLLPFDGGHMAIATYERLRSFGGRVHRVDAARMLPLTYAVVGLVLLIGLFAIFRDIVDPIQL